MNEKLEQIQKKLEEIANLDLADQPDAFAKLHDELNQELNASNSQEPE